MNTTGSVSGIFTFWETVAANFLPRIFFALLVLAVAFVLGRIARKIMLRVYRKLSQSHNDITRIVSSVIYFVFLISGVFLALEILGLERLLTKILASAGIVGIIAGFAFKDIASSAFTGLLIKTRKPFVEGDWVQFKDMYGKVNAVTVMTTSIDNIFGQGIYIPNQLIYNLMFTNYSTYGKRRILIKSGVSYGDDLGRAKQVAIDEIRKSDFFLPEEPVDFYYTEIGDSTFDFELLFWIRFDNESEFYQARSDAIMNIKKRFEQENISIAYPVTTLDFGVKGGVNIFDKDIRVKS
jgi:small conductance mechanosensitive channel